MLFLYGADPLGSARGGTRDRRRGSRRQHRLDSTGPRGSCCGRAANARGCSPRYRSPDGRKNLRENLGGESCGKAAGRNVVSCRRARCTVRARHRARLVRDLSVQGVLASFAPLACPRRLLHRHRPRPVPIRDREPRRNEPRGRLQAPSTLERWLLSASRYVAVRRSDPKPSFRSSPHGPL